MKKILKTLLSLLLLFTIHDRLLASDTGCLLADSRVYNDPVSPGLINALLGTTPIYQNNQSVALPAQCTSGPSGSCRVCYGSFSSLLGLITGCPSGFTYGNEVNYIMSCPLNSKILLLFGICFGVFYIIKPPPYNTKTWNN